jgi:hypothetical protein
MLPRGERAGDREMWVQTSRKGQGYEQNLRHGLSGGGACRAGATGAAS